MRPMALALNSVNHRAPSGPVTIWSGETGCPQHGGMANSVICPPVVMRPIWSAYCSANQNAPSGPSVIPARPASGVGTLNSVKPTPGTRWPMTFLPHSVNQIVLSEATVIPEGPDWGVSTTSLTRPGAADTGPAIIQPRRPARAMTTRVARTEPEDAPFTEPWIGRMTDSFGNGDALRYTDEGRPRFRDRGWNTGGGTQLGSPSRP